MNKSDPKKPHLVPGKQRIYNDTWKERGRSDVVMWDVLAIRNKETLRLVFESKNSPWRQGVWLKTDRGTIINGTHCPSAVLWIDTAPREVIIECQTTDGLLSVYNKWDRGRGFGESQMATSGMLIEELPNGRRYRCNDIGFDDTFDKLVFRIEKSLP
jgi:hypothetical protein